MPLIKTLIHFSTYTTHTIHTTHILYLIVALRYLPAVVVVCVVLDHEAVEAHFHLVETGLLKDLYLYRQRSVVYT